MIIKTVSVTNFGSYPQFSFDFDQDGLSLIYGATGSGKSTFMDTVAWCLYGVTAKDGNVDEIRSWQSPNEPTTGEITVDISGTTLKVTRTRGKAGQNDLYWTEYPEGSDHRGKDLADTQKLLETRLGISSATFLNSSYLHEFSPTGTFWVASSKDRRKLFERIAPLEFPTTLALRASDARKETKAALGKVEIALAGLVGQLTQSKETWDDVITREATWKLQQGEKAKELALKAVRFETDRQMEVAKLTSVANQWRTSKQKEFDTLVKELEAIQNTVKRPEDFDAEIRRHMDQARCTSCKALPIAANAGIAKLQSEKTANSYNVKYLEQGKKTLAALDKELSSNPYLAQVEAAKKAQNNFQAEGTKILAEPNPYTAQAEKLSLTIKTQITQVRAATQDQASLAARVASLTRLYELSFDLRGQMLQRAVQSIQDQTNALLERYFDAEIRVSFSLADSDTLEVEIQKSGYDCTFRQLSKGQRQMLRLCFGVSVMEAVENMSGQHVNVLFFDEALDGFDPSLKLKSLGIFEGLAQNHQQVFLIDHSEELRAMISSRLKVTLNGDRSDMSRDG